MARLNKRVEGLVADPFRWPEAFKREKIDEARDLWKEFRNDCGLGEFKREGTGFKFEGSPRSVRAYPYAIDTQPGSLHEGCLTLEGKYLYGDYDLFHIVFLDRKQMPGRPSTVVQTGPKYATNYQIPDKRDANWDQIAIFINQQLGVEMIQHGSHVFYKPKDFQPVFAFGPGKRSGEFWSIDELKARYRQWNV